jgi:hypothetical protein
VCQAGHDVTDVETLRAAMHRLAGHDFAPYRVLGSGGSQRGPLANDSVPAVCISGAKSVHHTVSQEGVPDRTISPSWTAVMALWPSV